jgi:glycosyltransferase involved in cell wall biosynthesis
VPNNKAKVVFVGLRFAHDFYLTRHKKLFSEYYEVVSIYVDREPVIGKVFRRRSFFRIPIELVLLFVFVVRHQPKHIISIGPKVGLLSSIVARLLPRCSSAHWFTGQFWANSKNKSWEKSYWIDKLICNLADNTLCDGPSQSEFISKELSPVKETISICPGSINGVDSKFFDLPLKQSHDGNFRICFVGRKAPGKGLDELVELARECHKLSMNVEFVIAGPIDESFANYSEWKCGLSDFLHNLIFIDELVNPEDIFATCDAFILLSEREGFSGTVIQAQAAGLPVICSDIYGLRDTFIDEISGFSVASNDMGLIVSAINRFLCPETYRNMSEAARKFALQFSEDEFIEVLKKTYISAGFEFKAPD